MWRVWTFSTLQRWATTKPWGCSTTAPVSPIPSANTPSFIRRTSRATCRAHRCPSPRPWPRSSVRRSRRRPPRRLSPEDSFARSSSARARAAGWSRVIVAAASSAPCQATTTIFAHASSASPGGYFGAGGGFAGSGAGAAAFLAGSGWAPVFGASASQATSRRARQGRATRIIAASDTPAFTSRRAERGRPRRPKSPGLRGSFDPRPRSRAAGAAAVGLRASRTRGTRAWPARMCSCQRHRVAPAARRARSMRTRSGRIASTRLVSYCPAWHEPLWNSGVSRAASARRVVSANTSGSPGLVLVAARRPRAGWRCGQARGGP